ncbi:MAG: transposase family protein [Acidobacteria bacterium]|nr:transposase family protein [Acidobacteriota bacterium]
MWLRILHRHGFRECKHDRLETFLELKNGIPSHDTIAPVFARIKPAAFQERFARIE